MVQNFITRCGLTNEGDDIDDTCFNRQEHSLTQLSGVTTNIDTFIQDIKQSCYFILKEGARKWRKVGTKEKHMSTAPQTRV